MKILATLVRHHGEKKWRLAVGPEKPYMQHLLYMKKLKTAMKHPDIAEVMTLRRTRRAKIEQSIKKVEAVKVETKKETQKPKPKTKRVRPKKITRQELTGMTSNRFATPAMT